MIRHLNFVQIIYDQLLSSHLLVLGSVVTLLSLRHLDAGLPLTLTHMLEMTEFLLLMLAGILFSNVHFLPLQIGRDCNTETRNSFLNILTGQRYILEFYIYCVL